MEVIKPEFIMIIINVWVDNMSSANEILLYRAYNIKDGLSNDVQFDTQPLTVRSYLVFGFKLPGQKWRT